MIAFPEMLIPAAKHVNMPVPEDCEDMDAVKATFPHFYVFCRIQLGRRMHPGEHWGNAEAIMKFSLEEIKEATLEDLVKGGVICGV